MKILNPYATPTSGAGKVYIPEQTYTNRCNVIPFGGAWPATSNPNGDWRYQTLIKASAIGRAGLIKDIAVLPCANFVLNAQTFEVRMSHTTQTSHSTTFATNLPAPVVCHEASAWSFNGIGQVWTPLELQKGFFYNGTDNLTIEIRMIGSKLSSGNGACDTNSSSSNAPRRTYRYGTGAYGSTTASTANSTAGVKLGLFFSDAAYVPDNTPTTGSGNTFPFGASFGSNWRFQQLIPASKLPNTPVKITGLGFSAASSSPLVFKAPTFQVRMAHTTRTSLSTCFVNNIGPCPIELRNGAITYTATQNQWAGLDLDCAFGYDGVRNVLVEIRYRGRTAAIGSMHADASIQRVWANSITTPVTPDPYSASCGRASGTFGIKTCVAYERECVLLCADTMRVPSSNNPITAVNMPPNQFYQIAMSLGQTPLDLGNCTICLAPDGFFWASVLIGPPLFKNYTGQISSRGTATGSLEVLNIPATIGLCFYHAAVAYNSSGILCCTNTCATRLVP